MAAAVVTDKHTRFVFFSLSLSQASGAEELGRDEIQDIVNIANEIAEHTRLGKKIGPLKHLILLSPFLPPPFPPPPFLLSSLLPPSLPLSPPQLKQPWCLSTVLWRRKMLTRHYRLFRVSTLTSMMSFLPTSSTIKMDFFMASGRKQRYVCVCVEGGRCGGGVSVGVWV